MLSNQQIKIALLDDHNLFRKGLIKLINGMNQRQFHILFEAANGQELIAKLDKKALPDIVIMDIEMPGMSGFETVAWLQDHYPDINVLVVSMIETEEAIIRMLKMGVKGYLSKDIEPDDLLAAIKAIASKGYYYTDFITGKLIHSIKTGGNNPETPDQFLQDKVWKSLNEREREFIRLACSELTYEEIAKQMHVSPKTVEGYRDSVFRKMDVKNRPGMIIFAIKHKLVSI
jgi:two-component system, NarL family, invasion response regulator UvrY